MRSFTISTVAILSVLASEVVATPPACLLACASQVIKKSSTCNALNDISCVCQNETSAIKQCLDSICPSGDADDAYSSFESSCKNVGAEVNSSSSSSSKASSSSSKSASSSASSSAASSSSSAVGSSSSSAAPSSSSVVESSSSSSAAPSSSSVVESSSAVSSVEPVSTVSSIIASSSSSTVAIATQSGAGVVFNAPVGALIGAAAFGLIL